MFARIRYLFRRWWCEPRIAFTLHSEVPYAQARSTTLHLDLMVNRINRWPFRGYRAGTLRVERVELDTTARGESMPARVTFALRRGGWNRILLADGRLVPPADPADCYPADDFEGCFPDLRWSEDPPPGPDARQEVAAGRLQGG